MVRNWSARFTLGVVLISAPFLVLGGSLAVLAFATRSAVPGAIVLPLFAAGLVLEVVLGTVGVFFVLTAPELRPWDDDRLREP